MALQGERIQDSTRVQAHRHAFIEKNLGYLATEAIRVLAVRLEDDWSQERQRQYQTVLKKIVEMLSQFEVLPVGLIERYRGLLRL